MQNLIKNFPSIREIFLKTAFFPFSSSPSPPSPSPPPMSIFRRENENEAGDELKKLEPKLFFVLIIDENRASRIIHPKLGN